MNIKQASELREALERIKTLESQVEQLIEAQKPKRRGRKPKNGDDRERT